MVGGPPAWHATPVPGDGGFPHRLVPDLEDWDLAEAVTESPAPALGDLLLYSRVCPDVEYVKCYPAPGEAASHHG